MPKSLMSDAAVLQNVGFVSALSWFGVSSVVIFLKAIKGKSQNRISLKQQRILKNDKSESFLDFYLVYKYVCLKIMR